MKLYNITLSNLLRRKAKVVFVILGLFIGIGTIVTLLSITRSMSVSLEEKLDRFGANIVMVPKSDNLSLSYGDIQVGGVSYQLNEFDEQRIGNIHTIEAKRNLGAVAPKVLGAVRVKGKEVLIMGVDPNVEFDLKTWWNIQGNKPGEQEVVIGAEAAKKLALQPGDTLELPGYSLTVAGVLMPTGSSEDHIIIGHLPAVQKILGKQGKITMVEIAAFCRDCPISDMVLQISEKFPGAKVTALRQAVMAKMQSIEMFKTFSYGISGLVVCIGSLLVFVTTMGSVNERTREIGIFRAIGFRQSHVLQIILLEAALVGLVGGFGGLVIGNIVARTVLPLLFPQMIFSGIDSFLAAIIVALSISLSIIASFQPARKGSRLDPSVALRAL